MRALSRHVFRHQAISTWGAEVLKRVPDIRNFGLTRRLSAIGVAVSEVVKRPNHQLLKHLSEHKSDIARQWAVYALNALPCIEFFQRLDLTRPFAADPNMSVRECAWMAFRPHLSQNLLAGLKVLTGWAKDRDPYVRRFAIEVTRPRSVWGEHIPILKSDPHVALPLLVFVKSDISPYVRTALGNWLHDAWKSSPRWVESLCRTWNREASPQTKWVVRRALRTKHRRSPGKRANGPS